MFSKIILNKDNLQNNLNFIKKQTHNAKICAMVKANAYGHGLEEIVGLLKGKVDAFGIVNLEEALRVREIDDSTTIILFGACDDVGKALQKNISLTIISYENLKNILKISKKYKIKPRLHLNINSGMNRFGIKTQKEFYKIIHLLKGNNLTLEGVFTHFSSLTTDQNYTIKQRKTFDEFVNLLPKNFCSTVHVGGGNSIFSQHGFDMYRVGMFLYGYGHEGLKPVMSVKSQIVNLQSVKKGEYVGYMASFKAMQDMKVCAIPLGYDDGVKRGLSNNFYVKIQNKLCKNVGKICMDCFMVDVTDLNVKLGDEVEVLWNASEWCQALNTTEYEILTNFNGFRGERIIN